MKVGFHFNADHESLGSWYGLPIKKKVFETIINHRSLNISSKIFIGDLLLLRMSMDLVKNGNTETQTFNKSKYDLAFQRWIKPDNVIWKRYPNQKILESRNKNIFVICFESIDNNLAEYIHKKLESFPPYLGAIEVDESSKVHWNLYSGSLIPFARIINKNLTLFHQDEDDKDYGLKEEFEGYGFNSVNFECLNYKYTIFDTYHNFEQARRIAEWKKKSGAFLAFVADDVVSKLSDTAPDLGNKLWSALKTFEDSETNEQLAQVTTSCRRIFEYVTDCIFPPSDELMDGHSLKADKYKNRIFAYAETERVSKTNIDLIIASSETLFKQWDKLNSLANKGVHGEVFRGETRRCLLRTILLLDDIISLKEGAFQIKADLDFDGIFKE